MSRNGVWELQNILLRYSHRSGSSRGVRDFLDSGALSRFASLHPHLLITTSLRHAGHPYAVAKYRNGYEKTVPLRNADPELIGKVVEEMRTSLGHALPPHHRLSVGVVESKTPSVQGYWRSGEKLVERGFYGEDKAEEGEKAAEFAKLVDEVGLEGAVKVVERLLAKRSEYPHKKGENK